MAEANIVLDQQAFVIRATMINASRMAAMIRASTGPWWRL